jgi:hypothetical protein
MVMLVGILGGFGGTVNALPVRRPEVRFYLENG